MKRIIFFHSVLLGVIVCLCSCSDEMNRMKLDIKRLDGGLNDLRSFQAEQTTKIDEIQTQMRELQGKIEELQYSQNQRLGTALDSLKGDLSTLKKRVPPPAIVPVQLLEEDEGNVSKLPSEIAPSATAGLQQIRDGNFDKALSYWQEVLDVSMGTEWAAMALFWTGVSYDGLGNHKKAMESYHDVVTRFPKWPRAPFVMSRQASVLIRLGDKKTAKLILNKIIADYPKSGEATKAKERLKDL